MEADFSFPALFPSMQLGPPGSTSEEPWGCSENDEAGWKHGTKYILAHGSTLKCWNVVGAKETVKTQKAKQDEQKRKYFDQSECK